MRSLIFVLISFIMMASSAQASVIQYTNKAAWEAAVPSHSTIDFVGWPDGTPISTQYHAAFGITFQSPGNWIVQQKEFSGLKGQPGSRFYFDTPRHAVAVTFIGNVVFNLYYQGTLVFTSIEFWDHWGNNSMFAGLVSDAPFDEVYIYRNLGAGLVVYDDLHFGPPIPAPGALGVFALAAFGCRRRRR